VRSIVGAFAVAFVINAGSTTNHPDQSPQPFTGKRRPRSSLTAAPPTAEIEQLHARIAHEQNPTLRARTANSKKAA
jgi:hypothetical protein